jgi:hypothetical protein
MWLAPFISLSLAAFAADALWSPSGAPFSAALPAGWTEGPRPDEQSFSLLGPGKDPAFRPVIAAAYYDEDPAAYLRRTAKGAKPSKVSIGGREAKRVRVTETRAFRADERGGRKAAKLALTRELVAVPDGKGFWLVSYSAADADFKSGAAGFEALLKSFSFK